MFDRKLMKYKDIMGNAYEVRYREDLRWYANIYTYLVVYDNGIKFKKYKKYECITDTECNNKIAELISNGYETVDKWIKENRKNLLDKKVLNKEYEGESK